MLPGFILCMLLQVGFVLAGEVSIAKPDDKCPVCLQKKPYEQDKWISLDCSTLKNTQVKHSFHKICLANVIQAAWRSKNEATCLFDRTKISENDINQLGLQQDYLKFLKHLKRKDSVIDWDSFRRLPPTKVAIGAGLIVMGGWTIFDMFNVKDFSIGFPGMISLALMFLWDD